MPIVLVLLLAIPLIAVVVSGFAPIGPAAGTTVACGMAELGLAIALIPALATGPVTAGRYLQVDSLAEIFVLGAAFLYAITALYTIGYRARPRTPVREQLDRDVLGRRFLLGLNVFAWSMIVAPTMSGLATLWIAIEITTIVSALLVAVDRSDRAAEAAWKYVLLASCGLGIALLATVVMYYAGSQALGESYDLAFGPVRDAAAAGLLPATPVRLAFVLAVVGFGTKVGLVPMHTWLPDAHAEAPTPVSVLLSGSLLAVSFYAILRYYQVTSAAVGGAFGQRVLLVFGGFSLLLAAAAVLTQRNLKRLLAYSSIEHMGILAIGVGFGTPVAAAGVMLHVLAHAAAKGNAFMGAGVLVRTFGSKELGGIRAAGTVLPWSAPLFAMAVFALGAMPPFGIFRSEFEIVRGGVGHAHSVAAGALVVLVTVVFVGLTAAASRMLFTAPDVATAGLVVRRGEPHWLMVAPVVIGMAVLVWLGVHPPAGLTELISRAAAELQGVG